jgi:hypothetical protein
VMRTIANNGTHGTSFSSQLDIHSNLLKGIYILIILFRETRIILGLMFQQKTGARAPAVGLIHQANGSLEVRGSVAVDKHWTNATSIIWRVCTNLHRRVIQQRI